jgi:hypothetical protein
MRSRAQKNALRASVVPACADLLHARRTIGRVARIICMQQMDPDEETTKMTRARLRLLTRSSAAIMVCGIMALPSNVALAAPGPGTLPVTATATVQTAMAFVVHGSMAAAIVTGLVGALRR